MENFNELASLQNQVNDWSSQDKLGKQHFRKDMKKVFEPVCDTIEYTPEDVLQIMMATSKDNSKALVNLNDDF